MMKTTLLAMTALILMSACNHSSDSEAAKASETLAKQANKTLGMPGIVNFEEKRTLKMLYELRDKRNYRTYTYIVDMHGKLHKLCNSMGYGIPYSAQYSNPEKFIYGSGRKLPQAEPNGMFMPTSSSATWVLCVDRRGKAKAVYVEPTIIVSPMALQ